MSEPIEGPDGAALLYCGEALWRAVLVNTPFSRAMYQWMTNLVPLCTAIEVTTARNTDDDSRIGVILELPRVVTIPCDSPEGGSYHESQTVVQAFDGREVTWTNCQWVRIPVTRDEWREAVNGGAQPGAGLGHD